MKAYLKNESFTEKWLMSESIANYWLNFDWILTEKWLKNETIAQVIFQWFFSHFSVILRHHCGNAQSCSGLEICSPRSHPKDFHASHTMCPAKATEMMNKKDACRTLRIFAPTQSRPTDRMSGQRDRMSGQRDRTSDKETEQGDACADEGGPWFDWSQMMKNIFDRWWIFDWSRLIAMGN